MMAVLRLFSIGYKAPLITIPFGLVTLSIVLSMRTRFRIIAAWRRMPMALCHYVLGIRLPGNRP